MLGHQHLVVWIWHLSLHFYSTDTSLGTLCPGDLGAGADDLRFGWVFGGSFTVGDWTATYRVEWIGACCLST